LEHNLHPETIDRLTRLVKVFEENPAWLRAVQPPPVRESP
jgi:hypothetical protein